jgi:hypothetical protein
MFLDFIYLMNSRWNNIRKQASGLAFIGFILYACTSLISCGDNKQPGNKPAIDSTVYFPINSYIQQQIKDVDTTPYYVYRVQVINKKKDSTTISRAVFDSLTKQFMLPELEETALKKNFTEPVYADESTGSITLTYTPKDSNSTIKNAMVLLDTASQNVKWIFVNMLQNKGDSTIIQKIGWKGNESCYLNRSVSYADGKENKTQLNIVWNKK